MAYMEITEYKVAVTVERVGKGRYVARTDSDTYTIQKARFTGEKWIAERQSDYKPFGGDTIRECALQIAWGYK